MTEILKKYKVLSIGYNCGCKKYIDKYIESCPIQIFDYTGTSVWGILELLKNDFKDLLEHGQVEKKMVVGGKKPLETNLNTKYYVRFFHDDFSEEKYDETVEKNLRRIERFKDEINSDKHIVFLRFEEEMENRIQYTKIDKKEYEQLIELSNWIKKEKKIKFKIIFINSSETKNDVENNIISIKDKTRRYVWENSDRRMNDLMDKNKKFIETSLGDL